MNTNGSIAAPSAAALASTGRQALLRAAPHELLAELVALDLLERAGGGGSARSPLRAARPNSASSPISAPSVIVAAEQQRADHAAGERDGQAERTRAPPGASCGTPPA